MRSQKEEAQQIRNSDEMIFGTSSWKSPADQNREEMK